jgi:hypothetical protein
MGRSRHFSDLCGSPRQRATEASGASQVLASARCLSGESQQLKAEVERLLSTVRAA